MYICVFGFLKKTDFYSLTCRFEKEMYRLSCTCCIKKNNVQLQQTHPITVRRPHRKSAISFSQMGENL